jgi:acetyl-CoA carboxylase biotin carboxyl carrier protein
MTLTAADVAEIMRLVEQSGFDELNLEIDGTKISLRRGTPAETTVATQPGGPAPAVAAATAGPGRAPAPRAAADPNVQDLPSPLLGTFYRAPKPGAPPFVEVGVAVEADTIVGIIEVMKLMNTVRAGVRGTVAEVLAADGALVEFGETLLRVRKTG